MYSKSFFLVQALAGSASAAYLYAASYSGIVTTLKWTKSGLEPVSTTEECGGSPSWLTLDSPSGLLHCTDEAWSTPEGSISTFKTAKDGSLELVGKQSTLAGAVSAAFYGKDKSGLALAYYSTASFAAWDRTDPANLELLHTETFELDAPGPNPDRQEAPHPHQAIVDPTGAYILVPDLGSDLVHIFSTGSGDDLSVKAVKSLEVPAGSGPRHAAFAVHGDTTFLYVVTELSNLILGYIVTYEDDGLSFEKVYESGTHGEGVDVPETAAAAEILVSPDQKFLIVSSRNENALEIPNFDAGNSTKITSDPLINFSIDGSTGGLTRLQEVAAGGKTPRHFSFNKDASAVAVGLQGDGTAVIIKRDVKTGKLGKFIAHAEVGGQVSTVIFNESI